MTQARVVIVPLQGPVRRRRLDLALALAMLNKAVRVHERAERAALDSRPHALAGYHAEPMGA
jgi:hypothetical protein